MHVLMITQRVDPKDDVFGFTHTWIEHLAERVEKLDVLTAYKENVALPDNVRVRSYGKERGFSKPRRILEFQRHCLQYALEGSVDIVFAHMMPNFVLASWPWLRPTGANYVLWYAHGNVDCRLQLAHRLVDRVVTSTPSGFNLESNKVDIIGHGIDTERFSPSAQEANRTTLLGVGRLDPIKNFEVLIDAVHLLVEEGHDVGLNIVGKPHGNDEHYRQLQEKVSEHNLHGHVEFVGEIPYEEIDEWYRDAGLFLNASTTGSLDKTEQEAMASGTPVISCNQSYRELVSCGDVNEEILTFEPGDAADLADKVKLLLETGNYSTLAQKSREMVCVEYDVDGLMARFEATFEEVSNTADFSGHEAV